jgi:hypothetical protein
MRSLITGLAALAAIVGVELPLALADGNTSPGDHSVFVSEADIPLKICGKTPPILTATINSGKSNHVLMVQVMILLEAVFPPVTGTPLISARPSVNGVYMEPHGNPGKYGTTYFSVYQSCPAACSITGMFWLDLDAAEAANKGTFLGKPLEINLEADSCNGGGGVLTHVTMMGQLLEK